jgi:hypothetical protein
VGFQPTSVSDRKSPSITLLIVIRWLYGDNTTTNLKEEQPWPSMARKQARK